MMDATSAEFSSFAMADWSIPFRMRFDAGQELRATTFVDNGSPVRPAMIRKLKSGEYRLYSRKVNPKTGKRRNLGTFSTRAAAEKHERAVQYFKRH
jgi:hypothetical protein